MKLQKLNEDLMIKKINLKGDTIYNHADNLVYVKSDGDRIVVICNSEESIEPLVLFMPSQKETAEEDEESIAALAKRVLGISIEVN